MGLALAFIAGILVTAGVREEDSLGLMMLALGVVIGGIAVAVQYG